MSELGRLERLELRNIWLSEASHFTPWLARSENLGLLSDAIGIELELEAQERNVGPFRADILCKDVNSGHWVLVENQLERTDHIHLGQLLTYASGLQAVTIVWIAARFTEEHRATLDWLNEITDDRFSFFGLEVELWRIGDSPAAPKFNIVSKPNDWSRNVGKAASQIADEALTETKRNQLDFWIYFKDRLNTRNTSVKAQKPAPQHWMNFKIGRSGFVMAGLVLGSECRIGADIYINSADPKGDFARLKAQRDKIETEFGDELVWMDLPDRKGARIAYFRDGIDPFSELNRAIAADWISENLEKLDKVFRNRIRALETGTGSHVKTNEDADLPRDFRL